MKHQMKTRVRTDLQDETTTYQLHRMINDSGYKVSLRTVLRCRTSLGWTFRGSTYSLLIHGANKVKRQEWVIKRADNDFEDVIRTDECTVHGTKSQKVLLLHSSSKCTHPATALCRITILSIRHFMEKNF